MKSKNLLIASISLIAISLFSSCNSGGSSSVSLSESSTKVLTDDEYYSSLNNRETKSSYVEAEMDDVAPKLYDIRISDKYETTVNPNTRTQRVKIRLSNPYKHVIKGITLGSDINVNIIREGVIFHDYPLYDDGSRGQAFFNDKKLIPWDGDYYSMEFDIDLYTRSYETIQVVDLVYIDKIYGYERHGLIGESSDNQIHNTITIKDEEFPYIIFDEVTMMELSGAPATVKYHFEGGGEKDAIYKMRDDSFMTFGHSKGFVDIVGSTISVTKYIRNKHGEYLEDETREFFLNPFKATKFEKKAGEKYAYAIIEVATTDDRFYSNCFSYEENGVYHPFYKIQWDGNYIAMINDPYKNGRKNGFMLEMDEDAEFSYDIYYNCANVRMKIS